MLVGNRNQTGFTLIELMVVIAVIALVTMMTVASINQVSNRRYSSEAEQLSIWLNQLLDFSVMQGAAYGIVAEPIGKSKTVGRLRATIYYRNQWVAVAFPEPFVLNQGSKIKWLSEDTEERPMFYQQAALPTREEIESGTVSEEKDEDDFLEPEIAFLPDGYIEPDGSIELSFTDSPAIYTFSWDDESAQMLMEKKQQ